MQVDLAFKNLVQEVLDYGYTKPSRVGPTISLPGASLHTEDVLMSFPILTTRKIAYRGVLGELAAFLEGAIHLADFEKHGCKYWEHNASQWTWNKKLPREQWLVGKVYGAQWRKWGPSNEFDQISKLISGLFKDPFGRRHILTTWNPEELHQACLPPCHLLAQFYVRPDNYIDCIIYMRSVDIALGLPSDLVLYAALLILVCKAVHKVPGALHFQFGDAHIYNAHIPNLLEQIELKGVTEPITWTLNDNACINSFEPGFLTLDNYNVTNKIEYELF